MSSDTVFGDDDAAHELASVTGDLTAGYTATLTAAIDPSATWTGSGTGPAGLTRSAQDPANIFRWGAVIIAGETWPATGGSSVLGSRR